MRGENRMDKRAKLKIGVILLSMILFLINYKVSQDKIYLDTSIGEMYASPLLWENNSFEEVFFVDHEMPLCMKLKTITWNYTHSEDECLTIELKKADNEDIIATSTINVNQLPDNDLTEYIYFDNVKLEKNEWYRVVLKSNISDEKRGIGLMCTQKSEGNAYAVINGERQSFNFVMIVYE